MGLASSVVMSACEKNGGLEDLPSSGVPSTLPGRELPGVLPAGVSIPVSLGGLMTPLNRQ